MIFTEWTNDAEFSKKFENTVSSDDYLSFAATGDSWSVLAPKRVEEVIQEGRSLCHAIAYWIPQIADGSHKVYFLRRNEALDVPFMTLDVVDGVLIECSGLCNCQPTREVKEYLSKWAHEHGLRMKLSLH